MKAMILAAGFGTRLQPLTFSLPKPMFPILNRPALEHSIRFLSRNGIRDIAVNLHHLPDHITNYFGTGERWGVNLHWSQEEAILGTAGGIKKAQSFLEGDSFVVINSDVVIDIDLKEMIRWHREKESCLTLVLRPGDSPETCDPIEVDDRGRIVHMIGQSSREIPESSRRFTFTGLQIMEPEIFDRIPEGKFYGTTNDVFPEMIADGRPIFAYEYDGYWVDIGRRESYLQVHQDALDGKVPLAPPAESAQAGGTTIIPPVWVGAGCQIAENARIGPYTVLGDKVIVDSNAVVEHSVVWDRAVVGADATVRDSILGYDAILATGETTDGQSITAKT